MELLLKSFVSVFVGAGILYILVWCGYFDAATTEDGYKYYAEMENPDWGFIQFPKWLKMPANSVVNAGYTILGFIWIYIARVDSTKCLTQMDKYMFYIFSWKAVVYGPAQYARIATQAHRWAILDQWYTFPFFAWVTVWGQYVLHGWNSFRTAVVMLLSCSSYILTLVHHRGFEVALGIHILFAVDTAVKVHLKHPVKSNIIVIICAVLSCAGFVCLKLLDIYLAQYKPFQYLTGHFWSKVCDTLQIHFVCKFFHNIYKHRNMDIKRK
ncbi:transmembrane protein 187-like [Saccoglossus kowalevskii]|uniref:Transmembrane protein 187-like n=1 Tax=Saccoglossus kowalevskii TaxID=10224 RepID=A0ABM0GVR3_SACKO|nr:PREDICTED: transmembrane protein 187-like [Saccoglossus kowalevskii]